MTRREERIENDIHEEEPMETMEVDHADSESDFDVDGGVDGEIGDIEGFDEGCDAASFGDFDPMQALGQLLVTQEGETIPDVLAGIRHSLDTLTKVLHKMSKQLETRKK